LRSRSRGAPARRRAAPDRVDRELEAERAAHAATYAGVQAKLNQ
jgi:hypothetical protein